MWLRKLGGADVKVNELGPITKVGTGEGLGPLLGDQACLIGPSKAQQCLLRFPRLLVFGCVRYSECARTLRQVCALLC